MYGLRLLNNAALVSLLNSPFALAPKAAANMSRGKAGAIEDDDGVSGAGIAAAPRLLLPGEISPSVSYRAVEVAEIDES